MTSFLRKKSKAQEYAPKVQPPMSTPMPLFSRFSTQGNSETASPSQRVVVSGPMSLGTSRASVRGATRRVEGAGDLDHNLSSNARPQPQISPLHTSPQSQMGLNISSLDFRLSHNITKALPQLPKQDPKPPTLPPFSYASSSSSGLNDTYLTSSTSFTNSTTSNDIPYSSSNSNYNFNDLEAKATMITPIPKSKAKTIINSSNVSSHSNHNMSSLPTSLPMPQIQIRVPDVDNNSNDATANNIRTRGDTVPQQLPVTTAVKRPSTSNSNSNSTSASASNLNPNPSLNYERSTDLGYRPSQLGTGLGIDFDSGFGTPLFNEQDPFAKAQIGVALSTDSNTTVLPNVVSGDTRSESGKSRKSTSTRDKGDKEKEKEREKERKLRKEKREKEKEKEREKKDGEKEKKRSRSKSKSRSSKPGSTSTSASMSTQQVDPVGIQDHHYDRSHEASTGVGIEEFTPTSTVAASSAVTTPATATPTPTATTTATTTTDPDQVDLELGLGQEVDTSMIVPTPTTTSASVQIQTQPLKPSNRSSKSRPNSMLVPAEENGPSPQPQPQPQSTSEGYIRKQKSRMSTISSSSSPSLQRPLSVHNIPVPGSGQENNNEYSKRMSRMSIVSSNTATTTTQLAEFDEFEPIPEPEFTSTSTSTPLHSHSHAPESEPEPMAPESASESEFKFIPRTPLFTLSDFVANATLLKNLLEYLTFYDWCLLASVSRVIRVSMVQKKDVREEVLERYLNTVGYERWGWEDEEEPLSLSLQDLSDYMRGVSTPTHEYARIAGLYVQSLRIHPNMRDLNVLDTVRALTASARAYTRVVLRLRAQAEKEWNVWQVNVKNMRNGNGNGYGSTTTSRPSSRAPSPTYSSFSHSQYHNGNGANGSNPTSRHTSPNRHPQYQQQYQQYQQQQQGVTFRSPLFRLRRAPLLRVFVPSPEGDWLSDRSVLECEAECKRAGVLNLLRVGDVVWDIAVGDEGNVGRLVWDGSYLIDLDYTYSPIGELPKYMPALAFPPSYFHRVIRISGNGGGGGGGSGNPGNPIVHIDLTPWGEEIAANLQLLQDRVRTETPQGAYHNVVRWVHRSSFVIRPPRQSGGKILIPMGRKNANTNTSSNEKEKQKEKLYVDSGWYGTIVVETEGTNESLADLQDRCGPGVFPPRIRNTLVQVSQAQVENRKVFRILREKSRPGEIWIKCVSVRERLL